MAVFSDPRMYTYKAGGAIPVGYAVKFVTDDETIVVGAANTDRCLGIAQGEPGSSASSGDDVEVALPGGGARAKLGENVARGDYLVSHTDGTLVKANAEGDHVIAYAMESGSSGDVIGVEVVMFTAHAGL